MYEIDISYANLANLPFLEEIYEKYLSDPTKIDDSWKHFFEGMQFASLTLKSLQISKKESPDLRIYHLIEAYRVYGHLLARCDPLQTHFVDEIPELSLKGLGFQSEELKALFPTCGFLKEPEAPLEELIAALKKTYCGTIGIEYMNLGEPELEGWLQKRIEPYFDLALSLDEKKRILYFLNKAELFESFIHTKYVGQKRFSLEGGETLIPMLATLLDVGSEEGVEEVILGMAHRGRLNVLTNILNKSYAHVFNEFEDYYTPELFESTGDVKYHKGFEGTLVTRQGKSVKVTLAANPSHLESVDPVVEGEARAKTQLKGSEEGDKSIAPILIHGDASVTGQGVVYETLQLSKLRGYKTGGTVHIVVNNQIGFTTFPHDGRSTRYCTDIAKAFGIPVFHVNAEDPEGCVAVAKIAIQIRQKYQCDVFIDLNCYRKYGHNESDEPFFTQPLEYQIIKAKKSIRELYRNALIEAQVLSTKEAEQLEAEFKQSLHEALESIKSTPPATKTSSKKTEGSAVVNTQVDSALIIDLAKRLCTVPEGLQVHSKIQRLLQERLAMVQGDPAEPRIDWGMGETLAYATLLWEGYHVRLSGQDVRRGTFTHRHAILVDQSKGEKYFPLSHLKAGQGAFDVFNSPLSEYAVLGFEFGYSLVYHTGLILWEAQFGDFFNGGQIIVDQYLSATEQKWGHRSNLVLLLPHGYEGQGPEHSSARIERFLQLCGEENMRIANCTTPGQFFHLLRRQVLEKVKKPLIVFTPKAFLRHPACVSSLKEFTTGAFQWAIDDPAASRSAKRLFFCSGKFYYDFIQEREKRKQGDSAIIRIEQLYPFPKNEIAQLLTKYKEVEEFIWIQEEQQNMGAWSFVQSIFDELLMSRAKKIRYIGRPPSASPAAGSHALHKKQQATLMDEAFTWNEAR